MNSERVPSTDLFFLWTLVTPGRHLNLPMALAMYMARKAKRLLEDSPFCGGHFITHLARSYLLLTRDIIGSMVLYDERPMILQLLDSMRILLHRKDGILSTRPDDEVPEEDAVEPGPKR